MHIVLTDAKRNRIFSVEHTLVMFAEWNRDGELTTSVVTGMRGPNGQLEAFGVKESPQEVARRVNYATMMCSLKPGMDYDPDIVGIPKEQSLA